MAIITDNKTKVSRNIKAELFFTEKQTKTKATTKRLNAELRIKRMCLLLSFP